MTFATGVIFGAFLGVAFCLLGVLVVAMEMEPGPHEGYRPGDHRFSVPPDKE